MAREHPWAQQLYALRSMLWLMVHNSVRGCFTGVGLPAGYAQPRTHPRTWHHPAGQIAQNKARSEMILLQLESHTYVCSGALDVWLILHALDASASKACKGKLE